MSILSRIFRRNRWTEDDSRRVLEEPIPPNIADLPFEASFGYARILEPLGSIVATLIPLALVLLDFGLVFNRTALALLSSAAALTFIAAWLQIRSTITGIRIDDRGVSIEHPFGTDTLSWWSIDKVEATPSASAFHFYAGTQQALIKTAGLKRDQIERLLLAIAARIEPRGMRIVLRSRARFNFAAVDGLVVAGAHILVVAGISVAALNTSHALGIRCSVASQYLKERFHTADQRGCVILRVSGASEGAGLREGDLMIEMNGIPVTSGEQFSVLFDRAGKWHFTFTVLRPGVSDPLHFDVYPAKGGKLPHTPKSDPLYYYLLARWNSADGQVDGPIADYTQAITMEPQFDLAYLYRGDLYDDNAGGAQDGERDILQAVALSPELGEAHRYAAHDYARDGLHDLAVAQAYQAINLDECIGGFTGYNIDCAEDYLALAVAASPNEPGASALAAERSTQFYDGFAAPYFWAALAYHTMGTYDLADVRARQYLAFPESKRNELWTWEMQFFTAGPDTPVPPPPDDYITPITVQFFNEQGTPVPLVPIGQ